MYKRRISPANAPYFNDSGISIYKNFDAFNRNFGALYHSGNIPHNARTHCGDVAEIINELATQLAPNQWRPIQNIASSMQSADEDIIVPVMQDILAKTEVELSLISSAILDKEFEKALWLKERYRFDVTHLYERLDEALTQMSQLRSEI